MAAWQYLNNCHVFTPTVEEAASVIDLGAAIDATYLTAADAGAADGKRSAALIALGNDLELVEGVFSSTGTVFTIDTVHFAIIAATLYTDGTKMDLDGSASVLFTTPGARLDKFAGVDIPNVWTAPQKQTPATLADATAWDGAAYAFLKASVSGSDFDIANPSALVAEQMYAIRVDYASANTVSFGTDFKGPIDTPTGTSGAVDWFFFFSNAAGDALEYLGASLDAGA
ncbi:MAG: hypothetical protein GC182_03230 [Rhodopseudomonas sp.]|nr:hypothetical protein [Rhodopseudomonas sp.]